MLRQTVAFASTVVLGAVTAAALQAQSLAVPAEFPPTSYTGSQYVDSNGCAFVRAGNSGLVNWIPRVSRNRQQLCGFVPSDVGEAPTTVAGGPLILFDDPVEPAAAALPTPEEVQPEAPAPLTFAQVCEGKFGVQDGFLTANGDAVDCGPAPVAAVAPAPVRAAVPTPAPVRIPEIAPVAAPVAEVAPPPAPVAAPESPRMTLAQVCEGRFGVQDGFITSGGDPVDCGSDPMTVPVATPAPTSVPVSPRVTLSQACEGRFGLQDGFITSGGDPVDCGLAPVIAAASIPVPVPAAVFAPTPVLIPDPEPTPRRVSLTKICAEIAATGKRVINAATGKPVVCPSASMIAAVAPAQNLAPAAPGQPMAAALPAAPRLQAPAASAPVAERRVATAAVPRPAPARPKPTLPFTTRAVPASNPAPAAVAGETIRPPAGYERVWHDGRLNPHRGIRKVSQEEAAAMGLVSRVGARATAN